MARYLSFAIMVMALATVVLANLRLPPPPPPTTQSLYKLSIHNTPGCGSNLEFICRAPLPSDPRPAPLYTVVSSVFSIDDKQIVKILLQG